MDSDTLEVTVSSRGGERCDARIRHHVIRVDQPPDVLDHDTGPTPVELFVAAVATDVAQHACRYLHRFGLPAATTVTARFRMERRPARLGLLELELSVVDLPLGLRDSLVNALEHCPTYESLRFRPETSITLRPDVPDMRG